MIEIVIVTEIVIVIVIEIEIVIVIVIVRPALCTHGYKSVVIYLLLGSFETSSGECDSER